MSDKFAFECPTCRRPGRARLEYLGRDVACKYCDAAFRMPERVEVPCPACRQPVLVGPGAADPARPCPSCGADLGTGRARSKDARRASSADRARIEHLEARAADAGRLEEEAAALRARADQLAAELAERDTRSAREQADRRAEREAVEERLRALVDEVESLARLSDRERELWAGERDRLQAERNLAAARAQELQAGLDEQRRRLDEAVAGREAAGRRLEEGRALREGELASLRERARAEQAELRDRMRDLESSRDALESENRRIRRDWDEVERRNRALEASNADLRRELNVRLAEAERIAAELVTAQRDRDHASGRIAGFARDLEDLARERAARERDHRAELDQARRAAAPPGPHGPPAGRAALEPQGILVLEGHP